MRHHEHAGARLQQELLQPGAGLQVEVVGRLVQQQDFRLLAQHPGQPDAHLPALGELAHGFAEVLPGKAQADEHPLDALPPAGIPAGGHEVGEVLVALKQTPGFRRFGLVARQLLLHACQLLGQPALPLEGLLGLLVEGRPGVQPGGVPRLGKVGQARAPVPVDRSAVGLQVPHDHAHEGGLAAAVGAAQREAPALGEREGDGVQDHPVPEGEAHLGERDHQDLPKLKKMTSGEASRAVASVSCTAWAPEVDQPHAAAVELVHEAGALGRPVFHEAEGDHPVEARGELAAQVVGEVHHPLAGHRPQEDLVGQPAEAVPREAHALLEADAAVGAGGQDLPAPQESPGTAPGGGSSRPR